MTNTTHPSTTQRKVIIFLGLCLMGMLFASIYDRIDNPQLMVQAEQGDNPADQVGKLMQHVSQHPNELEAYIPLIEALIQAENWPAAETFAERAVALEAKDPRPLYLLGIARHNQGRNKEAAEALERVAVIKNDGSVRYSLAVLYIHFLDDPKSGIEHIKAGLQLPNLAPALKTVLEEELQKATTGHPPNASKDAGKGATTGAAKPAAKNADGHNHPPFDEAPKGEAPKKPAAAKPAAKPAQP